MELHHLEVNEVEKEEWMLPNKLPPYIVDNRNNFLHLL